MRDRARYREQCTGTPAAMWSCEQFVRHANVSGAPGNSPRRSGKRSRRVAARSTRGSLKRHEGLRARCTPHRHSRPSGRRATIPGGTGIYDTRTTRTERVWVPGDTPWPMRYLAVISQLDVCMRDRARYREQCTGTPAVMWSCEQLIHHANVSGAPGNSPRRPRRRSRRAARFCRITRPKWVTLQNRPSLKVMCFTSMTTHFSVAAHLYYPPGVCRTRRGGPSAPAGMHNPHNVSDIGPTSTVVCKSNCSQLK